MHDFCVFSVVCKLPMFSSKHFCVSDKIALNHAIVFATMYFLKLENKRGWLLKSKQNIVPKLKIRS